MRNHARIGSRRCPARRSQPRTVAGGTCSHAAIRLAVRTGIDVTIPDGFGCGWRDLVAALRCAVAAIGQRFGPAGLLGAVTPAQVMAAASGSRLLAPGWPPLARGV